MAEQPQTALVTGASGGIGEAICRRLLQDGFQVVSLSLEAPVMDSKRLVHCEVDLTDPAATEDAARWAGEKFALTHIVHSAGAIRQALLEEVDRADLSALAELHLGAAVSLVQAALPAMKAAGFGRIVNIASRAALGVASRTSYSATKAGMIGMTRTWALELGSHGITANAVAPGPIAGTAMFEGVVPPGSQAETQLSRSVPVGRLGRPEDVAHAVAFLLSPDSSFITGQTLYVCGGASVGSVSL